MCLFFFGFGFVSFSLRRLKSKPGTAQGLPVRNRFNLFASIYLDLLFHPVGPRGAELVRVSRPDVARGRQVFATGPRLQRRPSHMAIALPARSVRHDEQTRLESQEGKSAATLS